MTAQKARDTQAAAIIRLWTEQAPTPESVLRAITAYTQNPQGLHLAAHLVTACREAGLVPGV